MNVGTCPTQEELAALQRGEVAEELAEPLLAHVAECSTCQNTLASLDTQDETVIGPLRRPRISAPYAGELQLQEALARARAVIERPAEILAAVESPQRPAGLPAMSASGDERSRHLADRPPPSADLPRIGGHELLEKLGEGGMGAVYKARHRKLKRLVAIKLLPKERMSNPRAAARFEREMEAVGAVDHPNIVRAMDADEDEGTPYLVVEYVDGQNLTEVINRLGPLRIADACELIRQAAVGLQHAHEHGLVHRDIKPSNLMLTREGIVKILDLGLALLQTGAPTGSEMTATGSAMGTADYVAPEQVTDSHNVDIRADIYSLGCTLYKLLSGRAPFVGPKYDAEVTKMMAHVHDVPPPLAQLRTDLPPELGAVIERMMAKDCSQRFGTPAEVVAAIAPFAAGCDLIGLAAGAAAPSAQPPVVDLSHVGTDEHLSSPMTGTEPRAPTPTSAPGTTLSARGSGRRRVWIALAAAAATLPVLLGIWVIIRDKYGKEVGRVQIPPGGSAQIVAEPTPAVGEAPVPPKPGDQPLPPTRVPPTPSDQQFVALPPWNLPAGSPPPANAPFDAAQAKQHQEAWAQHLGVPVEITNSIGMPLVLIPPGEFEMGITEQEAEAWAKEAETAIPDPADRETYRKQLALSIPKHRVRVTEPFYLGKYEVTQQEYESVVGRNPSEFAKTGKAKTAMAGRDTARYPVDSVSWLEAIEFGESLSTLPEERSAGRVYRLPREAEWEHACRAGATTRYSWGDEAQSLTEHAWVQENAERRPHAVGLSRANAWGLHDMHGNVWELCADRLYSSRPRAEWHPLTDRGGSFGMPAHWTLCSVRDYLRHEDARSPQHGFRLVCLIRGRADEQTILSSLRVLRMEGEVRIGLPVKVEPAQIEIKPEARESGAESAARFAALVTDSAPLPGVRWWTLETRGHRGPANTVAYSPDGKWLVTGSDDGAIRIWDSAAGKLVRVLLGHSGAVRSVCWSPDGRYLASGGSGKTIQLWEPRAGLLLRTFTSPSEGHTVRAVAWSPDGKTLASCNGGTKPIAAIAVNLWDVVSGRILRSLEEHNEDVTAIVWSPDATRLASAGKDNRIRIWDPATGRLLRSIETNMVAALAWSPDGKTLASCLGLRHGEPIPGATLWDVDACEPRGTLMQTKLGTGAIAWSPAGTNLCCASPMDSSDVEVWSIGAGQFFYNAPVPFYNAGWASGNRACVWSPDGTRFAIAHGSGRTYVFRSTYGSRLYELPHHLGETRAVAFSPDGSHLASGHAPSTVDIWETGTGKPTGKRCKIGNRSTNCVSWSPDAQKVAFGTSPDQTVRILGVVSGRQHFMKASAIPNAAAWCSTGHRIACGGARAGVFDPASGERLLDLREYGDALAWSHDDRRIAVGGGNAVAICDSKTGQESQSFYCGFWPTRLAWSPDERLLAVSGWSTGIQVWNIEARRLVTTLETSIRGGIHFLRWDQDGRKLISGGETQTCVWDAADGKLLQTIPTGCRDLSPDGTLIAFPHPSMVRLSRFSDGHTVRTILGLEPDGYAVISPEGHWTGSGNAAEELVYVVQTEIGEQLTLTAAEFAARYGWKNDPSKVTPQPDAIRQQPASGAKSPGGAGQEKAKESGGPR